MDSLKKASKKSINQSKVNMLSSLGQGYEEFDTSDLMTEAENAVGDFILRVRENMQSKDLIVKGGIADMRIEVTGTNQIDVFGNPWLLYQDRGVNGSEEKKYDTPHSYTDKRPPAYVFEDYIRTKNIQLKFNENYTGDPSPFEDIDGNEKAIKSAAYAMATKIYKEGFKPQNFYAIEIPSLVDDLKAIIPSFVKDQIVQQINAKAADLL